MKNAIVHVFVLCLSFSALTASPVLAQFKIRDDPTGGDCATANFPGDWDDVIKTCSLNDDVSGNIEIKSNDIILDGADHTLTPAGPGQRIGIFINNKEKVVVRDIVVTGFEKGVYINSGRSNNVSGVTATGGEKKGVIACGICLTNTKENTIAYNVVTDNLSDGILLRHAENNLLDRNTVSENSINNIYLKHSVGNSLVGNIVKGRANFGLAGIDISQGSGNMLTGNEISGHATQGIYYFASNKNTAYFNKISQNSTGVELASSKENSFYCNDIDRHKTGMDIRNLSTDNKVWLNNFLNQDSALDTVLNGGNKFNQNAPPGGNYWAVNAANCQDVAQKDGYCDNPYNFPNNQDNFPHVNRINWEEDPYICSAVTSEHLSMAALTFVNDWKVAMLAQNAELLGVLLDVEIELWTIDGRKLDGMESTISFYVNDLFAQNISDVSLTEINHSQSGTVAEFTVGFGGGALAQTSLYLRAHADGHMTVVRQVWTN